MRVFIGSPFKGLETIRAELHDALEADYEVAWMEDFGSQEEAALDVCLREVEDSNVYVLLFGSRYGTLLPKSDYSYTQLEYERARQTGTRVLAYVQHLSEGEERDLASQDFLRQVDSALLREHGAFASSDQLIAWVRRDLERLRARLMRPKFPKSAPITDEDAYALGEFRTRTLKGAPFTVTLVDAGAIPEPKYRPGKRGRLGPKIESIERVAAKRGALVQIFNDFPIKSRGDLVRLRAESVKANARLIVVVIGKAGATDVVRLFDGASGERVVFAGDWVSFQSDTDYTESFSDDDLDSCDLRAAVLDLIESRLYGHVARETA